MTRFATIFAALPIAAPAAAQEQIQPPTTPAIDELGPTVIDSDTDPRQFDLARKKVVECEGQKFVFAWGAGAKPTRVTLCSKKDATTEEVVQMLDDAANKLEQAQGMPEDRRVALVQQIRGKISELQSASAAVEPAAPAPPAAVAQRPVAPPTTAASNPVSSQPRRAAVTPVLPAKPRLTFHCYTPGDIGSGGPCTILGRDTRLTVSAGEAVAGATTLRFVRNGRSRAELSLAQLRKGQSVRLTLPRQVCAGVVEAEMEIEVLRGGQVVDSIGPYLLRC